MRFSRTALIAATSLSTLMLFGSPATYAKDPNSDAPQDSGNGAAGAEGEQKGKHKGKGQGGEHKGAPPPEAVPIKPKAVGKSLAPGGGEPVLGKPEPKGKTKSTQDTENPSENMKRRTAKPPEGGYPNAKFPPETAGGNGAKKPKHEETATPPPSKLPQGAPPTEADQNKATGETGESKWKRERNKGTASKPPVINPSKSEEPKDNAANPPGSSKRYEKTGTPETTTKEGEKTANPPDGGPAKVRRAEKNERLDEIKKARTETKSDDGKKVVIKEPDNRTIIKLNNKIVIQHDETERIRKVAPNAHFEKGSGGMTISVVERPGNVKIYSESDASGQLIRRYRRDGQGHDTIIIDNRSRYGGHRKRDHLGKDIAIGAGIGLGIAAGAAILDSVVDVPPPRITIPRQKYIVEYEGASEDDVYEALNAPPVDVLTRRYTLDEVRATYALRERMRRIDLDDINFEFGSWEVDPSEYRKLERVARAMKRVIRHNPNEVFLIEGYTDAVGSREDNLSLSDRRAESVAVVLTEQFDVPFENLTTQGYGEDFLKVDTEGPERANRRVAVRRITPLIANNAGAERESDARDRESGDDEGPEQSGDEGPDRRDGDYGPYHGQADHD